MPEQPRLRTGGAFTLAACLVCAVATLACGGRGAAPPRDPTGLGSPAWLAMRTPLAIEYLNTLPDTRIGEPLEGLPFGSEERWLAGFVYHGEVRVDHPGLRVVALADPLGEPVRLVWVEDGGEPWSLPSCGTDSGVDKVGVRARDIAGEVYTWKSLAPGAGIVKLACPPPDWPAPTPR